MSKIYNKGLSILGVILMLFVNAIFIASVVSAIYVSQVKGPDFLTIFLTVVAFICNIFIIIVVLKKCFIRISIFEDKVVFSNLLKGVLVISKEDVSLIYVENIEDTPVYICIETKDGLHTSDNPLKIKYDSSYAPLVKKALKDE